MQHPRSARRLSQRQKCANARARANSHTHTSNWINCTLFLFRSLVLFLFSRISKKCFPRIWPRSPAISNTVPKWTWHVAEDEHTQRERARAKIRIWKRTATDRAKCMQTRKNRWQFGMAECWRCNALCPSNRVCVCAESARCWPSASGFIRLTTRLMCTIEIPLS